MPLPTAVEPFVFRGRTYHVKRDDTIHPLHSGNKYRKLHALIETPPEHYEHLISYGGTQSNAMLSLAALCHEKQWRFTYYAKTLPRAIEASPTGNLKGALALGMELVTLPHDVYREQIVRLHEEASGKTLVVAQGGAEFLARSGVTRLAEEIRQWCAASGYERATVVTPSGTGTTALYLAAALPEQQVVTTSVVGDAAYLKEQISRLAGIPANLTILEAPKHPFAKPHPEFLALYQELYAAGLEIDLIYGVRMWRDLLAYAPKGTVLYVHSGGLPGNETMLERYRYLGMLS